MRGLIPTVPAPTRAKRKIELQRKLRGESKLLGLYQGGSKKGKARVPNKKPSSLPKRGKAVTRTSPKGDRGGPWRETQQDMLQAVSLLFEKGIAGFLGGGTVVVQPAARMHRAQKFRT